MLAFHRELSLPSRLITIGAPSSAGAYAPGQEKAPAALRAAGLLELISAGGVSVEDAGDVAGFRWRADKVSPRAMNADAVYAVARGTADRVASALASDAAVLVLGGDCTVELGTVAGALRANQGVGLVYVDLDTDLNTPESTEDGALDWMGVAHLLVSKERCRNSSGCLCGGPRRCADGVTPPESQLSLAGYGSWQYDSPDRRGPPVRGALGSPSAPET